MGCLYMSIGIGAIIAYVAMFQLAYEVNEKSKDLKTLMEVKSIFVANPEDRKYWGRVLRSIPRMGMNVGGFNRVEREAVPVYIDFSIKQIVSILLAFK